MRNNKHAKKDTTCDEEDSLVTLLVLFYECVLGKNTCTLNHVVKDLYLKNQSLYILLHCRSRFLPCQSTFVHLHDKVNIIVTPVRVVG